MKFRAGFEDLANLNIPSDITPEGLEQYIKDVYNIKFLGAYNELKASLSGSKIGYVESVGALAFTDISTNTIEAFVSLPKCLEYSIGVGAYFGLAILNKIYNRYETKRKHRMSYLLSIHKELGK